MLNLIKNMKLIHINWPTSSIRYNRQLVMSSFTFTFYISPPCSKLWWRLIIQCWMCTTLVIILPPVINDFPSVNDIAEPVLIQTFIAKPSVKFSINSFYVGLPGRIKRNLTPCSKAHWSIARQVNSGPGQFLSSPDSPEKVQCCPEYVWPERLKSRRRW